MPICIDKGFVLSFINVFINNTQTTFKTVAEQKYA